MEDATESFGASYHDGPPSAGRGSVLYFNGNKIVTTGGGGAILTRRWCTGGPGAAPDDDGQRRIDGLPAHEVGYNFRLPNLNAALGCAQLETTAGRRWWSGSVGSRSATTMLFDADRRRALVFDEPQDVSSNYWLNTMLLDDPDHADDRDAFWAC